MFRSLKRVLSLLLSIAMMFGCLFAVAQADTGEKKLTVMLYLCGADLESQNGQATGDLGKILQSRYNTEEINVIALAGGSRNWKTGYSNTELTVINVTGRRPTVIETWAQASMADPDTLSRFINYCHENYPAETYVLDMWDHGGGPVIGLMQDQNYSEIMSMQSFVDALDNSVLKDEPLDLLIMNACLMGSVEVGALVAPYARYMAASQDSFFGFTYEWLSGAENTSIVDSAKILIDNAFVHNKTSIERQSAIEKNSLAVIDLSKMDAVVAAMDAYFPKVASTLNASSFTRMSAQRRDSATFGISESGGFSNYDLVDLGDLVANMQEAAPAEAKALLAALDEAVIYCRSAEEGCTGLTIYHPFSNKKSLESFVAIYNDLDVSKGYMDYMHHFVAQLTDTPLASWTNLHTGRAKAEKAIRTLFTMELTAEQAQHYGSSRFEALLQHEDNTYTLTFVNNNATLEDNALTAEFSGHALYAVDADATRLSPALDYSIQNGMYVIPARLTSASEDGQEASTTDALIYCSVEGKNIVPGRVYIWDESMQTYTGALQMSFADYATIELAIEYRQETRNASGTLLPFDQWEIVRTESWTSAIDGSWSFALVDDTLDTSNLYATFEICDSQNNFYNSDLLKIKAEAVASGEIHVTYDDCEQVVLEKCTIAVNNDQLLLSLSLQQLAETECIYVLQNVTANASATEATSTVYGSGLNWGLLQGETQYAVVPVSLAGMTDEVLTSITFDLLCLDADTNAEIMTIPVSIQLHYNLSSAE